jgi:hypothetical protein
LDKIQETLNKLQPAKRLELVIKLLPFVLTKMNDFDFNINQSPEQIDSVKVVIVNTKDEIERYDKIKDELERYDNLKINNNGK